MDDEILPDSPCPTSDQLKQAMIEQFDDGDVPVDELSAWRHIRQAAATRTFRRAVGEVVPEPS